MRQIFNKEAYEAPSTTMRVVLMEGNCMAASNDPVVHESNTSADITLQEGGDEIIFDGSWEAPKK